jgi:hypothetical protein
LTGNSPSSVFYLYDAPGRRVARFYEGQEAGTWPDERVVYDGLQPIEERSLDGATVFRRYWPGLSASSTMPLVGRPPCGLRRVRPRGLAQGQP